MKLKIGMGQPKRLVKKAQRDGGNYFKIKEGENNVRVLFGPVVVNTVFYPTIQRSEDGEVKATVRSVKVPDRGGIFAPLSALDRRIQRAHGEERPRSAFDSKSKWNYLVIDLDNEPYEVQVAQFPKSIFEELVDIETKRSNKNATMLRYGPIWMVNLIITKTVDPSKSAQFGTEYKVEVDPENPWNGKVPAEWLDSDFAELLEAGAFDPEEVFPNGMIKALEEAEIDLEKEGIPDSEDAVMERLQAFPVDLDGKDKRSGAPLFKHKAVLVEELTNAGVLEEIPMIESGGAGGAPQLTEGSSSKKKAVDAEYVEVEEDDEEEDDEEEVVETKGKKKLAGKLAKLAQEDEDDEDDDDGETASRIQATLRKADKAVADDDDEDDDE